MTTHGDPRSTAGSRRSWPLAAAFGAALAANVIHNRLGVDAAILPAAVLVGLYWWRPRTVLLWASAVAIAVPAFSFLRWEALADPADLAPFLNHLALLAAGALAAVSALVTLSPKRRRRPESASP